MNLREVGLSHTVFATVKAEGASHLTGRDAFVRGIESGYLSRSNFFTTDREVSFNFLYNFKEDFFMTNLRKFFALLVAVALVFSFVACNKVDEKKAEEPKASEKVDVKEDAKDDNADKAEVKDDYYPVTITTYNADGDKIDLTFDKAPEKVLCVYQSAIENMLALGLGDRVIANAMLDVPVKDEWKDQFDKVEYFEKAPSKEAVLDMAPDMIISWSSYFRDKTLGDVKFWHDRGVKTYINLNSGIMQPNKLEYEYEDIRNLGKIFNKNAEAEAIIAEMDKKIADGKKLSESREPVKAVILEIEGDNQFRNYGEDSIGGNIATLSGADLVFEKSGKFGLEELIEKNPEVIFTVYFGDEKLKDGEKEKILNNPQLQSLDAVKNGRVYPIMLSEVYSSGVRTADGIDTIVNGLYNEK